jgi:hypothetical protein
MRKIWSSLLVAFVLFGCSDTPVGNEESLYQGHLLVSWEFNNATEIGYDNTNGGNTALVGDGSPSIEKNTLLLDGASGLYLPASDTLGSKDFALEVKVFPKEFSSMMNIITTEPPGTYGDGWILRLENNTLYFLIRDGGNDYDWIKYKISSIDKDKWSKILVECFQDSIKAYINDEMVLNEFYSGDASSLDYQWGIGYDATHQEINNRYFNGKIDYIRYYEL